MKKLFVIINYNTPDFIEKLIMSINKFVQNAQIIVFDNSDKNSFINTFNNVNIIDNTQQQIINFDDFLSKYPKRFNSPGKTNHWASAKHSYTIDKCIEMIDENFILLDSDVLLKKDISELFDDNFIYAGEIETQPNGKKRVFPFLCYLNVHMLKDNNIHYFDERYMHGLGGSADAYDSGGGLYINTQNFKHRDIHVNDYCVHYGSASWGGQLNKKKLSSVQYFEKYKDLWYGE